MKREGLWTRMQEVRRRREGRGWGRRTSSLMYPCPLSSNFQLGFLFPAICPSTWAASSSREVRFSRISKNQDTISIELCRHRERGRENVTRYYDLPMICEIRSLRQTLNVSNSNQRISTLCLSTVNSHGTSPR